MLVIYRLNLVMCVMHLLQIEVFVSICRASESDDIREATQVFDIRNVAGLDLFNGASLVHSSLLVTINHIEKTVTCLKVEYQSYW